MLSPVRVLAPNIRRIMRNVQANAYTLYSFSVSLCWRAYAPLFRPPEGIHTRVLGFTHPAPLVSPPPPPQCQAGPPNGGGGLHYIIVALKLQQFQYNRKKTFLRHLGRLVFPFLFSQSPPKGGGGGGLQGGELQGGEGTFPYLLGCAKYWHLGWPSPAATRWLSGGNYSSNQVKSRRRVRTCTADNPPM